MADEFQVGDLVRVTGTWTDENGIAYGPNTVLGQYKDPSGNVSDLVVPTHISNPSTGVYTYDIDVDEAGTWLYRFYGQSGTGGSLGANESYFEAITNF